MKQGVRESTAPAAILASEHLRNSYFDLSHTSLQMLCIYVAL